MSQHHNIIHVKNPKGGLTEIIWSLVLRLFTS